MPVPAVQQDVPPGKRRSLAVGGSGTLTFRSLFGEATGRIGHFWLFDGAGKEVGTVAQSEGDLSLSGVVPVSITVPANTAFIDFENDSQYVVNISFVPSAS